nr:hypothetical protein [Micromonospora sp. DSM 115978]
SVYAPDDASALADLLVQPNFAACQQGETGESVSPRTPPPGALAAFRSSGTVPRTGTSYVGDVIYLGRGPVLCFVVVVTTTGLPDTGLEDRLVNQVLDKLNRA